MRDSDGRAPSLVQLYGKAESCLPVVVRERGLLPRVNGLLRKSVQQHKRVRRSEYGKLVLIRHPIHRVNSQLYLIYLHVSTTPYAMPFPSLSSPQSHHTEGREQTHFSVLQAPHTPARSSPAPPAPSAGPPRAARGISQRGCRGCWRVVRA